METSSALSTAGPSTTSEPPELAPPCPTDSSDICGGTPDTTTTCSSSGGNTYALSCGIENQGTVIDTSGVSRKRKRAVEPTFQDCQNLCDSYNDCVALNYEGTNCTLLSSVTGVSYVPGAIGASIVSSAPPGYTPTAKSTVTPAPTVNPTCPDWEGQIYNDTDGTPYIIGCYTLFAGNDIGTPVSEHAFIDCLMFCDTLSGCDGVIFDADNGVCYLKSSFDGQQTSGTGVIYGRKDLPVISASVSASVSLGEPGSYGGGGTDTNTPTLTPSTTSTSCEYLLLGDAHQY